MSTVQSRGSKLVASDVLTAVFFTQIFDVHTVFVFMWLLLSYCFNSIVFFFLLVPFN